MRMESVAFFFDNFFAMLAATDFSLLFIIEGCAFVLTFAVPICGCVFSQKLRTVSKKPFLYAARLFAAITFVVFASRFTLAQSLIAAALFWCAGTVAYGALCAFKPVRRADVKDEGLPLRAVEGVRQPERRTVAATAQTAVRLDHALSIADKLLVKNLGRGDRQELEKIKTQLTVLKVKNSINPQEGENLNLAFNTLLKLMAKYDL